LRRDFRAHGGERIENPAHRPAAQRSIARNRRREGLPCEDAGEKAHRGAGIARVERPARRFQAAQAFAGYANRAILRFNFDSETSKTIEGALAIGRGGIIAGFAYALGER